MSKQTSLLGLDAVASAPRPAAYTVVRCVCGTRVVVGAGVARVGCPACRQIVSGVLLLGGAP